VAEDRGVPTHRDYPWERDARAERERADHPPPAVRAQTAGRRARGPVVPWGLNQTVGALEIAGALGVCAVALFVKVHQAQTPADTRIAAPQPPPHAIARSVPTTTAVQALHSRFVSKGRLELWGRADAPDGTTVRVRIQTRSGAGRPLTTAPVSRGHFYATARLPEDLRTRRVTVVALTE
jgi:hypothetical protein